MHSSLSFGDWTRTMTDLHSNDSRDFQRRVSTILLDTLGEFEFVLAGSGALREHGLVDRPTQDVDLFTVVRRADIFPRAAEQAVLSLKRHGFDVHIVREAPSFFRIRVSADHEDVEVDLAVDDRAFPPANLEIGPVLSTRDAVSSKLSALYGRNLPRDYLDVDSIQRTTGLSHEELLALALEHEPHLDSALLAQILLDSIRMTAEDVREYGVTAEELSGIQNRLMAWGRRLSEESA